MNYKDFFIAIYIHQCKSYCDEEFFSHLFSSDIGDATVEIVDNSLTSFYSKTLSKKINHPIDWIEVSRDEKETLFLRNVYESVNYLRNKFLKTSCKYFVTLEADVIPPKEWLHYFLECTDKADIVGGIYYLGFHPQEFFDNPNIFQTTNHVLSGCTLYKREVIEKVPFRYDKENRNAFPDALICFDAARSGYKFSMANYSKIKCRHLTKQGSDSRGMEDIS